MPAAPSAFLTLPSSFVPASPLRAHTSPLRALPAPAATPAARRPAVITAKKGSRQPPLGGPRPGPPGAPGAPGQQLPEDGTPVFTLFVRNPDGAKLWYPVGALQGDGRSKSLVMGAQTKWGRKFYQGALDKGVAKAVFGSDNASRNRMMETAVRQFPQLKRNVKNLEFGYQVSAVGIKQEDFPKVVLTKEMTLTFFEWAKLKLSQIGKPAEEEDKEEPAAK